MSIFKKYSQDGKSQEKQPPSPGSVALNKDKGQKQVDLFSQENKELLNIIQNGFIVDKELASSKDIVDSELNYFNSLKEASDLDYTKLQFSGQFCQIKNTIETQAFFGPEDLDQQFQEFNQDLTKYVDLMTNKISILNQLVPELDKLNIQKYSKDTNSIKNLNRLKKSLEKFYENTEAQFESVSNLYSSSENKKNPISNIFKKFFKFGQDNPTDFTSNSSPTPTPSPSTNPTPSPTSTPTPSPSPSPSSSSSSSTSAPDSQSSSEITDDNPQDLVNIIYLFKNLEPQRVKLMINGIRNKYEISMLQNQRTIDLAGTVQDIQTLAVKLCPIEIRYRKITHVTGLTGYADDYDVLYDGYDQMIELVEELQGKIQPGSINGKQTSIVEVQKIKDKFNSTIQELQEQQSILATQRIKQVLGLK